MAVLSAEAIGAHGLVSPILIGVTVLLMSWGAAALWVTTGWTIIGQDHGDLPFWLRLILPLLPATTGGAIYVWRRRSIIRP